MGSTNKWGKVSAQLFQTLEVDLQLLLTAVLVEIDIAIVSGYRDKDKQNEYYEQKLSKTAWPYSQHNYYPSRAVDIVPPPYPVDWNKTRRNDYLGGFVLATANSLGIGLRWGGDWDRDHDPTDQSFNDLIHFELWPHLTWRPQ